MLKKWKKMKRPKVSKKEGKDTFKKRAKERHIKASS